MQLVQRVRGVGRSTAHNLCIGYLEPRLPLDCEAGHCKPVVSRSGCRRAMRWLGAWNEDDAIQMRTVHGRSCRRDMSDMNRIESPAEDAQPHDVITLHTPAVVAPRSPYVAGRPDLLRPSPCVQLDNSSSQGESFRKSNPGKMSSPVAAGERAMRRNSPVPSHTFSRLVFEFDAGDFHGVARLHARRFQRGIHTQPVQLRLKAGQGAF
jgi:hypothetical protein